jgi:gamma-glutamyltranspeptidase/glutathione hydrolase
MIWNHRVRASFLAGRLAGVIPGILLFALTACAGGDEQNRRPLVPEFPAGWRYPPAAPPLRALHGMVVSTDSAASAAGLSMLQAGGNAVDAAVATHFALAVVNPEAGNIGGGGFLVLRMADDSRAALDFREKAPLAATADMFLDTDGRVTDAGVIGHLASGVPGSVAGMEAAWSRFGTLPWWDLLQPAIRLARDGFTIRPSQMEAWEEKADTLRWFPATAAVFLPGGEVPSVGTVFRQPDLTRTLESIAVDGAAAFYTGWIADSTVAEMERGAGLVTHADLAAYEAVWRDPVVLGYRGYDIITMPPPSSGGITLGQMLNIVEGFDLTSFGWLSADHVHVAVEAMRRAYADRNYYLGDPDFVRIPLGRLLSQTYADSLAATINMRLASPSAAFTRVPPDESEETTHYSIVDREGNAVAVTTTINGWFGSKVVVRGAGYLLNNEMDDFTSKPGVPNQFGLVQGTANAIEPGKRMLSAMAPTILVSPSGSTELVTGTPGGATIITTVFQIVTDHIDFGIPVRSAIDAPRFHHQHLPDTVRYEPSGLPPEVVAELERRGHALAERFRDDGSDDLSGDVQSIHITSDGIRLGASDRRRGGRALGF